MGCRGRVQRFYTIRTTLADEEWGDGRHLAIESGFYRVRIQVTGDCPHNFGTDRPTWMVRSDARLEHYDVVSEAVPATESAE